MPLFMDVHNISGGVAAGDVAKAHMADLQTQGKYDVRYLRYSVDEQQGKVFCLVEAPSADAASTVHHVGTGKLRVHRRFYKDLAAADATVAAV